MCAGERSEQLTWQFAAKRGRIKSTADGWAKCTPERIEKAKARTAKLKQYFGHCDYVAVDLAVGDVTWNYHNLDCISSLRALCFRDESFDAVLCTQVLEHLEWPRESVAEFFRVLKPGGRLFITAPMAQEEHQIPYDFFRYTSFGLRSICERAGLKVSQIQPLGGMFARWAYELPRLLSIFPLIGLTKGTFHGRDLFLIPVKSLLLAAIRVLQVLLFAIDRLDRARNDPLGWSVIAHRTKPLSR